VTSGRLENDSRVQAPPARRSARDRTGADNDEMTPPVERGGTDVTSPGPSTPAGPRALQHSDAPTLRRPAVVARARALAVVVGVAVVAAAIAWLATRSLTSPEDARFEARAPEPSLITVAVEARTLSSNVVFRGTVLFSDTTEITVDAAGDAAPVVTGGLPAVGTELGEGSVVVEVSGRPVLLLEGVLPAYRDLRPGGRGEDVRQLEVALERLGFDPGPDDGVYDLATEAAVSAWYRALGYLPNEPSDEERTLLESARDRVDAADDAAADARRELEDMSQPLADSERLAAEYAVASAQRDVAAARVEQERQVGLSELAVTAAVAAEEVAQLGEASAVGRLAAAEAGVHPDTGVPPTAPELADLRTAVVHAATALAPARAALAQAIAERDRTVAAGADGVASAEESLAVAIAEHDERVAPPDAAGAQRAISNATEEMAEAQADLAALDAGVGVGVPRSEVMFLPQVPLRVNRVLVAVGDPATTPVMEVSGATLVVDGAVSAAERPLVTVGQHVRIDDEALGIALDGQISELADEPGTNDVGAGRYSVRVIPIGGDPQRLQGLNARVTVPVETTEREVLAVPLAALSAGPDGLARVQRVADDGTVAQVAVIVGLIAQGYAQVEGIDADLAAGDQVVVGLEGTTEATAADHPDNPIDRTSG
jgi:peptidoglycan hydrolase-like protein with peptidoglycan-binding domain